MHTVTESKVIDHDVRTVYNQWTQFEEFPRFMEGVERVDQLDDKRLHWVAEFGGSRHEWDAEITEQVPDQRVAWRSTDGKTNSGAVSFRPAESGGKTEVTVAMQWEPEGFKEKVGGALGFDDRRVKGDLERLESLLDERGGRETGAWRGEQR
jgi:uncharacterized membrane protein